MLQVILTFFGGASGTYRSLDQSTSYSFSNSGNDSVGPTRGIISDGNYIYTCTSQGVFRSDDNGVNWIQKNNGLTQLLCHGIISTDGNDFPFYFIWCFYVKSTMRIVGLQQVCQVLTQEVFVQCKILSYL